MLKLISCTSAISVIAFASYAHAQVPNQGASPSETVPDTSRQDSDGSRIEEIVVTAQRFTDTAQKTPLIISVISGDDVSAVTDVRQLQNLDPGVQIAANGNVPNTFVRGVGSINATLVQEASVAYNVDGVVLFTPTMITPSIFDLERVEILKGPQGTLYGRNASGGAVNLITRGAKLDRAEGYIEGELGNYDLRRLTGGVNMPLSDTLAIRIAGTHAEHDAYLTDGTDDQNMTAGRVRLLWQPSSKVSLKLGVDGSNIDANGAGATINPNPTGIKWIGQLDPRALAFAPMFKFPPLPPLSFKNKQWSAYGQLDVDMGFANLTVLPAYRHERSNETIYNTILFRERALIKQKSLEVRLAQQNDALRWVIGAYYFKMDQNVTSATLGEVIGNGASADVVGDIESYATFGEATFGLTDAIRLIGGLRYTHEKTNKRGQTNASLAPPGVPVSPDFNPAIDPGDYAFDSGTSRGALSWKAGVEADLSPTSMLFATVSRGFKGGGTFVDRPGVDTKFDPEFITAFELGSRNRFLNNTLQINAELFYWKLDGQQLPYLGINSVGALSLIIANAAKSRSYGADLDIVWRPTPNDTLTAGGEYLNARYDNFVRVVPALGVIPGSFCSTSGVVTNPASPVVVDCSGLPTLRSPKWSATASYEHRFQLGNGDDITAEADTIYQSRRDLDIVYTPEFRQPGKAQFNASLTYNGFGRTLSVRAWIKNIGNARIMTGGAETFVPVARATLLPPRTYGVTVRKSF